LNLADKESRSASRMSVNATHLNVAGSRPNSAASLGKLSTASRRGSSASGGTRGDVEDEGDADAVTPEKRRIGNRKKMVSAYRVRIAEGHELMETPSPVPNDSGADLAGDDEVEIQQVNKGR
jgi:hypothetical protein